VVAEGLVVVVAELDVTELGVSVGLLEALSAALGLVESAGSACCDPPAPPHAASKVRLRRSPARRTPRP
jgi:hypothetical protein